VSTSVSVRVFAPFIRTNKLAEILNVTVCELIVVRWQAGDLVQGVCDFEELFRFCQSNRIALYRNTNIHLKAVVNEHDQVMFGSANITNLGMGASAGNWELSGILGPLAPEDRMYLSRIVQESDLVDQVYFDHLRKRIEELKSVHRDIPRIPEVVLERDLSRAFLLSSLPMSSDPELLWHLYSNMDDATVPKEALDCALHDIVTYGMPLGLDRVAFEAALRSAFNTHPFIVALKNAIVDRPNRFMGFTDLSIWLAKNTTTVPTPKRWDIRDQNHVSILHNWITAFDQDFHSEKRYPNGSDRLAYR
jgi:hypothetical protein